MPDDTKSGSPIIVDGGGSILIDFGDGWYPPGADPDDHDHKDKKPIKTLKIRDAADGDVDLSDLIAGNPERCRIDISHKDPGGTITIKGKPCGVRFKSSIFKKQPRKSGYWNWDNRITKVKIHYGRGEGKEIIFDEGAIGKGRIFVDVI